MKAVIATKYGPPEVLKIIDIEKPIPKDNEVLIKVMATAVNSGDVRVRALNAPGYARLIMRLVMGFSKPRHPLGLVFAGVVEVAGKEVKNFKRGDEVYGQTGFKMGAAAEYITIAESKSIALKPKKASFEQAAAIPFGGTTAIYFLNKARIGSKKDQTVLIYGASGAVGTAAVQIAKHYGAKVTAVCGPDNVELLKSLGADDVIDYTKEDFTKFNQKYDIIFETVGKKSKKECTSALAPDGKFVTTASFDVSSENAEQLDFLNKLYDNSEYKSVIDRVYQLNELVEAHRYVDTGKKKGNVVIVIAH